MAKAESLVTALALLAAMPGIALAQDAKAGAEVFAECAICHQVGEAAKSAIGPILNGIVGRKAGTYPGYSYSAANKDSGITWDETALKGYLKNPRARMPGTKMLFRGLQDEQDISDVIAYLKQFGPDGKPLALAHVSAPSQTSAQTLATAQPLPEPAAPSPPPPPPPPPEAAAAASPPEAAPPSPPSKEAAAPLKAAAPRLPEPAPPSPPPQEAVAPLKAAAPRLPEPAPPSPPPQEAAAPLKAAAPRPPEPAPPSLPPQEAVAPLKAPAPRLPEPAPPSPPPQEAAAPLNAAAPRLPQPARPSPRRQEAAAPLKAAAPLLPKPAPAEPAPAKQAALPLPPPPLAAPSPAPASSLGAQHFRGGAEALRSGYVDAADREFDEAGRYSCDYFDLAAKLLDPNASSIKREFSPNGLKALQYYLKASADPSCRDEAGRRIRDLLEWARGNNAGTVLRWWNEHR